MRFNNYYDRTTLGYGCINILVPKIRAQTAPWCITPLKYFVKKGTNLYYNIFFCYLIVKITFSFTNESSWWVYVRYSI